MQYRILSMTAHGGGAEILLRVELSEDVYDVVGVSADLSRQPSREIRELVLMTEHYALLRPAKGVIGEDEFRALEDAAHLGEAVRAGMRILAFGANTKRTLADKLCKRGVSRDVAEAAAEQLSVRGYISEREDAVREAERNVRKMRGRNRIRAILRAKGYDDAAVAAAERYMDDVDFAELCARLIERRYLSQLDDAALRRKLAGMLMRNGYTMSEIRAAIRALERK